MGGTGYSNPAAGDRGAGLALASAAKFTCCQDFQRPGQIKSTCCQMLPESDGKWLKIGKL